MDTAAQKKHQSALALHRQINPPSRRRGIKTSMHPPAPASAPGSEGKGPGDSCARAQTSDPLHSAAGASLGLRNPRRRAQMPSDDSVDAVLQEGINVPGSGRRPQWAHDKLKSEEGDGARVRGFGSTHMLPPAGPPSRQGGRVRPNSASLAASGRSHIMGLSLSERAESSGAMAGGAFVRSPSASEHGVLRSSPMQAMIGGDLKETPPPRPPSGAPVSQPGGSWRSLAARQVRHAQRTTI
jgi:hypothetical protein